MTDTNTNYENELEEIAAVSMQMVIHAGDARNLVMEALNLAEAGDYNQVAEKLVEAQSELHQAHIFQTEVVQAEAGGRKYEYSMLFTHAQDTVMTIASELNLAKKIIALSKKTDERLTVLEQKMERV